MEGLNDMFSYMKEELKNLHDELRKSTFEVTDYNNLVKITVNGLQEIRSVKVDPSLIKPGSEAVLEEGLREAISRMMVKSREFLKQELGKLMGGIDLPNIF